MSIRAVLLISTAFASLTLPAASFAQDEDGPARPAPAPPPAAAPAGPPARDWITWGYDGERTGWNRGETVLSPRTVGQMTLKWTTKVSTKPEDVIMSTLTSPVVVEGVRTPQGVKNLLVTQGSDGTVFAIDAETGKILWQKAYPNPIKPQRTATTNCSNSVQATPTIDRARGLVFFTAGDGKLHGLALANGAERLRAIDFVAPHSRSWALNLIDNVIYVASGRGCGNGSPVEWGAVSAVDTTDLDRPQLSRTYTGQDRPAGPWGRGGAVKAPKGVLVQTADGPNDPGSGIFGNSVVLVTPKAYGVGDSFTPANWKHLNAEDLDFGSASPIVFPFGKRTLAAAGSKEAVVYLLDANNLGGRSNGRDAVPPHNKPLYQSPLLGNDRQYYAGMGVWGAMSTALGANGDRWLYIPMWGPPAKDGPKYRFSYGAAPNGSVMAFKVVANGDNPSLEAQWISRDLLMPDAVAVANGVVYAVQTAEQPAQHAINPDEHGRPGAGQRPMTAADRAKFRSTAVGTMTLLALDAETGKELYSSRDLLDKTFTHFTQPVVALGKVFLVDHEARVYAFGLK